jgi:hypothetical protein
MSRRGKHFAGEMADIALRHMPAVSKAAGTRDALVAQFQPHGEFVAKLEGILSRNDAVLERLKAADDIAVQVIQRAVALDEQNLARIEKQVSRQPSLKEFVPDDWEIRSRAGQSADSLIKRNMNGFNGTINGHS